MVAPTCPINKGQPPTNPRGTAPTLLPSIPIATDLPSLIRAVNIIRDILRNITTSLTVNNVYMPQAPREPKVPGTKTYKFSPYPDWYQFGGEVKEGTIYYKSKIKKTRNRKMRAFIDRIDQIAYRNYGRDDDRLFRWIYRKRPDIDGHDNKPDARAFQEDFFERIVNVHWGSKSKSTQPGPEIRYFTIFTGATAGVADSTYLGNNTWQNHTSVVAGGLTNSSVAGQFYDRGAGNGYGSVTAVGWSELNKIFADEHLQPTQYLPTFTVTMTPTSINATNNMSGTSGGGGWSIGQVRVKYGGPEPYGTMVYTMESYTAKTVSEGRFAGDVDFRIVMKGIRPNAPIGPSKPPEPTPPE